MRKLIVSEWITLDGIFDGNTMAEWEMPYNSEDKVAFVRAGILTSDALLLGRLTYEMLAAYWPAQKNNEMGWADWINSIPKYVVSSTLKKAEWNNSTIIKQNVVEEITWLKQQPGNRILLSGSATLVQSLMGTGLIDAYEFLIHPVIMGRGKRFFKQEMSAVGLKLVKTQTFSSGVILLDYQPAELTATVSEVS